MSIHDTQVIVKIKDTGTAIDTEILSQLFSNFASKSFEGNGLGLFIAKNIGAHDANAWAENNNDNNTDREKLLPFTLLYQLSIDNKM
ncbi:MAG TPA: ATP-binding protein [Nitrososphaeraceae archaeon]